MVLTAILVEKRGKYRIFPILGGALVTIGMLTLLLIDSDTNTLVGSLLAVVVGLGVGCLIQNTVVITMNSVEIRDMGAGNGANTLARLIGGSLSVALLGSLFTNSVEDTLADRLGSSGAGSAPVDQDLTPELLRTLPQTVQDAFADAVTNGLHVVAIGGAIVGVLTFVVAWLIRELPLRDTNKTSAENSETENSKSGVAETESGVAQDADPDSAPSAESGSGPRVAARILPHPPPPRPWAHLARGRDAHVLPRPKSAVMSWFFTSPLQRWRGRAGERRCHHGSPRSWQHRSRRLRVGPPGPRRPCRTGSRCRG